MASNISMSHALLDIQDLSVTFGGQTVVEGVSFGLKPAELLAIVGESGSGKSVTALSVLGLLGSGGSNPNGKVMLEGQDLLQASPAQMRQVRGNRISMIFQEPMTSLNPLHTIGRQIGEVLRIHNPMINKAKVQERTVELLEWVELDALKGLLHAFPHELSGGQRQRVMIAMALANDPDILIADEPTTALDVTVQAHILTLLKQLQKKLNMAIILITHDLTIVRNIADRVLVMHEGRVVESNDMEQLFKAPQHKYTKMLLESEPKGEAVPVKKGRGDPVMTAEHLKVYFPAQKSWSGRIKDYIRAVDDVSLEVKAGRTLGIVGESGSGKSTLAYAMLRLISSEGNIHFEGQPIQGLKSGQLQPLRQQMQLVFQDPFSSLNPRMSVAQIINEGLQAHALCVDKYERQIRIDEALMEVGLEPAMRERYPHEFSGGQRQRISVARSLV